MGRSAVDELINAVGCRDAIHSRMRVLAGTHVWFVSYGGFHRACPLGGSSWASSFRRRAPNQS